MALFADIHMKAIYRSFLLWQSMHETSAQSTALNYRQWLCFPQGLKVRKLGKKLQLSANYYTGLYNLIIKI